MTSACTQSFQPEVVTWFFCGKFLAGKLKVVKCIFGFIRGSCITASILLVYVNSCNNANSFILTKNERIFPITPTGTKIGKYETLMPWP